uniref:Secreted protein n=1 Tax=Cacopsylla melanoneura TaxID=428564 RepID=A0A8D8V4F3_9HEMI
MVTRHCLSFLCICSTWACNDVTRHYCTCCSWACNDVTRNYCTWCKLIWHVIWNCIHRDQTVILRIGSCILGNKASWIVRHKTVHIFIVRLESLMLSIGLWFILCYESTDIHPQTEYFIQPFHNAYYIDCSGLFRYVLCIYN